MAMQLRFQPKIHLLVLAYCAGASQRAAVEDTSPEVLDALLNLNVNGTLKLTRAVLPLLLARSSAEHPRRIAVVGSLAGHVSPTALALQQQFAGHFTIQ